MDKLNLGSIEFINSLPVDLGLLSGKISSNAAIVRGTPSFLNDKLLRKELDLGPVSSIFYAEHQKELLLLPQLSIGSKSAVHSVLLFSRCTLEELKGKTIAVTGKGRTTTVLLEIILRERYGFVPKIKEASSNFGELPSGCDAILLIGDEALTAKENLKSASIQVFDLADEWARWTGTPFVFAVWVVRREILKNHASEVRQIHLDLLQSKKWGLAHIDEVLKKSHEKTELPRKTLERYFSSLSYDFGDELRRGMSLYFEKAKQYGLLDRVAPFEFFTTGEENTKVSGSAGSNIQTILDKALAGGRVSIEEGITLYHEADLFDLGVVANDLCIQKNPKAASQATFVVDRNINYTNYCYTLCKFCAFYRLPGDDKEGYLRSNEEIFHKIDELLELGGTQVLLQGGHNPALGIEYYEDMVKVIHARYPQVHVHSFSASEIVHIAKVSKLSIKEILLRLKAVGLNSLPGGGAEILVDRVRQIVSPLKTKVADYFEVHRAAHEVGLISTATMVYGLGETVEERMMHFDQYRSLQDVTGGFRAFIPWSFESESTEMTMPRRTGSEYLRMIALSRIMLDNIKHLQAGWVTEGPKLSQIALDFGADDFGGILMEENVVSATKSDKLYSGVTKEEAIRLIRETGKTPVQRNTNYEEIKTFKPNASAPIPSLKSAV